MSSSISEHDALEYFRLHQDQQPATNWLIPPEYAAKAFEIAQVARAESPEAAIKYAEAYIEGIEARNLARQLKLMQARKLREDLEIWEKEHQPGQRKPEQGKRENTGGIMGWLSWFLNPSQRASISQNRQEDIVDEAIDSAAVIQEEANRAADEQTSAKGDSSPKSTPNAIAKHDTKAVVKPRRGCIGWLFFWRTAAKEEAQGHPNDHGLALPITNAGSRGWQGLIQRWLLTTLNATPTSGLNWMEITKDGLQVYQPLATVSQRAVNHKQIREGQVVLSVNPPAYFDSFLGVLRQFRRNVETPWGEIVIYEGGSGRIIASAIALAPDRKLRQMRTALELLHLAENEAEGFRPIPQLRDLLIYMDRAAIESIQGR